MSNLSVSDAQTCVLNHVTHCDTEVVRLQAALGRVLAEEIRAAVASQRDVIWEVLWNQVAYGRPLTLMKSTACILWSPRWL